MEKFEKWEELEKNIDVELNNIDSKIFECALDGANSAGNAIFSFKNLDSNAGFQQAKKIGNSIFQAKEHNIANIQYF